jgi:toxin ParE1/3/4
MARRIRTEAARLADYPLMGRVVPEYEDTSIRELIVAPYRVVYRIDVGLDTLYVVGIVHAARLFPRTVAEL